ncbi:HEPN/Toprim-associated domain-containing protein [Methylocella sp.]|uniref:HEPN/Toprim-associated domain-containing protein n=1 Tax=Methylocella sp. TaxID=1978226 RepID=UPI003C1713A9
MGTSIELIVSSVSLDYAKNDMGNDYGFLFQEGDETRRPSDAINYEYYLEHPDEEDLSEHEAGFVRPLAHVLPRLKLLGHSLDRARAEYEALRSDAMEMADMADPAATTPRFLTFEEFCSLACLFPLAGLNSDYIEYDTPEREKLAQGRFANFGDEFARVPWTENSDLYWSESSFLSAKLCILSAPSMLQVFSLNPANADADVTWQFGPLVNAGYASRESFQPGARRTQSILVATEGASDARIISRALDLLRPDVTDFFRFVDVDERHHFWGTGNLVKFAEGLLRIDVLNQVLFLLDNDAEGVDAYKKLQELKLPGNMRSMLLPDLEEFRTFPARGPEGVSACDINGRAAAIECYLDFNLSEYPPPQVVWTNYKKDIGAWHGALDHKESYMRHFLEQTSGSVPEGYDTSKLSKLLDALIAEASLLSASALQLPEIAGPA